MKIKVLLFLSLFYTVQICAQQTGLFSSSVSWSNNDGNQTRSLAVYVPNNYNASQSYSLIIGFHGQGDSPMNYIQNSKIMGFATDSYFGNVILVCPSEGPTPAWFYGSEDFGILSAIKQEISATYNINSDQVFAQGFSFGGKSAYLHGLREADEIKGIIAYSPAFYGDEDIYNNCISANCNNSHHDYNYSNTNKVFLCSSAGQLYNGYGEGYMTPLDPSDQAGATWEDSFLGLAMTCASYFNDMGGDAVFYESTNTGHSIAPISISKQCWDHVNQPISNVGINDLNLDNENHVKFYPNPTTGKFNINLGNEQIKVLKIYNAIGKEIKNFFSLNYSKNEVHVDLSKHKAGIYLIQIESANGNIIVEKIQVY